MKKERLQKILSLAGLGSRREMERVIEAGNVSINNQIAKLGDSADETAMLRVNGKLINNPLKRKTTTRILLYHKPIGEISSRHDPKHNKTVFDNLPKISSRWVQVGRLDINTSGLLIFTNNGELANFLMHPKNQMEREYAVRVHGRVNDEIIKNLKAGVALEDGSAKFKKIILKGGEGSNTWYHVVLEEGKNREVRRLWQSQNIEVSRLIRVRFAGIAMPKFLSRGKSFELTREEVQKFLQTIKFQEENNLLK